MSLNWARLADLVPQRQWLAYPRCSSVQCYIYKCASKHVRGLRDIETGPLAPFAWRPTLHNGGRDPALGASIRLAGLVRNKKREA